MVGGAIRDVLLGIETPLTDIDVTLPGDPTSLREQMQLDESTTSRFRTEKYGTMTIVKKNTPNPSLTKEGSISEVEYSSEHEGLGEVYELTPFREESGYADNRHPDQIIWSQDLVADSHRRDFTINALYRSFAVLPCEGEMPKVEGFKKQQTELLKDSTHLLTILKQHGGCLLTDTQTIILQSIDLIYAYLTNTLDFTKLPTLQTSSETSSSSSLSESSEY